MSTRGSPSGGHNSRQHGLQEVLDGPVLNDANLAACGHCGRKVGSFNSCEPHGGSQVLLRDVGACEPRVVHRNLETPTFFGPV